MASQAGFKYTFELDAASAEATAQRLAQIYQQQMSQIKIPVMQGDSSQGQALVAQARAQQAQITQDARAQANERSAAARAESQERIQQARASSTAVIEEEKRQTDAFRAEIRQREQEQREAQQRSAQGSAFGQNAAAFAGAAFGGPVGGLVGAVAGGNPYLAAGLVVNQGVQFMSQADQVATAYRRQSVAAEQLAGSQEKVNLLLRAYQEAAGGAIDKATALAQVTSLETLGFADTASEVSRFTRGARGASLAKGNSADYVISQAQLAIANQTTARLDQIGIGVEEFQNKLKELSATNKELTGSAQYEEAILQIWDEKFGALTDSAAGAATGMERLGAAWKDFQLTAGNTGWFNGATTAIANGVDSASALLGSQDVGVQTKNLSNLAANRGSAVSNYLSWGSSGKDAEVFQRTADLLTNLDKASIQGKAGMDDLMGSALGLASAMSETGGVTEDQRMKLAALELAERQAALGSKDMVTGMHETGDSAQYATGQLLELAGAIYKVNEQGQLVKAPVFGPMANPNPTPYTAAQQGFFGGTLLGSVMQGPDALQQRIGSATKQRDDQETKKSASELEAANTKAAREWESTAKKTEQAFEQAAKKMVDSFESKLGKVPGLLGTSEVTAGDMAATKAGTYQNKADEWLRRINAAANGSKDVNVDWGDVASRLGMANPGGDQKAQQALAAAATQQWASGALFADRRNLDLVNWGAVQADVNQQRLGEQGQRNLIDYANLDPRIVAAAGYQGILPGRLGGPMDMSQMMAGGSAQNPQNWAMMQGTQGGDAISGGISAGAMPALQKFGTDALRTITEQMTGDQAQAQWNTLGTTIAGMMTNSIETAIGQTDFVGVITASVLQQINDAQDNNP